jgi:hypothetical protein
MPLTTGNQPNSDKPRNWKKIIIIGVIATITPGGFIALGMYGIKKFLDRRKAKDVSTQGSQKWNVSDS